MSLVLAEAVRNTRTVAGVNEEVWRLDLQTGKNGVKGGGHSLLKLLIQPAFFF